MNVREGMLNNRLWWRSSNNGMVRLRIEMISHDERKKRKVVKPCGALIPLYNDGNVSSP